MKTLCVLTNIFAGAFVLASYAYGLTQTPNGVATLWGGVPESIRPIYGVGMILATLGYLSCCYYLFFHVNAKSARIFNYFSFNIFTFIYLIILIPSMLFIYLTLNMTLAPSLFTWIFLRTILLVVALGALLMIAALLGLNTRFAHWAYWLALAGSSLFFLHTFILDALVWPYFFRK